MARQRLPQAKAEASGAVLKNAGRFANRKTPKRTRPLGEPYKFMNQLQQECWARMDQQMPWLHSAHRELLKMACILSVRIDMGGDEVPMSAFQTLSTILSKLGATPTDETKVNHAGGEEEDPAEAFFSRPN